MIEDYQLLSSTQFDVKRSSPTGTPVDRLHPHTDNHRRLLAHLKHLINASERAMSNFYSRWRLNERRFQAYITLSDYENILQTMNEEGKPPTAVSITVPYIHATIDTKVSYLLHTFAGQKPIFQVGASKAESVEAARYMELFLQYNAERVRAVKKLRQWFMDGELYGVGVIRTSFGSEYKFRSQVMSRPQTILGFQIPGQSESYVARVKKLTFQGNYMENIDPFLFFPDHRVPMHEVNRRGEFVFWRSYEGKHELLRAQENKEIRWLEHVKGKPRNGLYEEFSDRSLLAGGESHAGRDELSGFNPISDRVQIDQGTVEIIPAKFGLGRSTSPEKWIFSLANQSQVIQAEPYINDHDMHPVAVIEPYGQGYNFGNVGLADYLGPIQDTISWYRNAHMYNVRSASNNRFIVNPQHVEMQDVINSAPGACIRLKTSGLGMKIDDVIKQVNVYDVTRNHSTDARLTQELGDALSGITDPIRGLQDAGGRKTATEARMAGEAGVSRLGSNAIYISSQGVVDGTEQMCMNTQQFLSGEFYVTVVGYKGLQAPISVLIRPDMVVGDFHFPVHDGTQPLDRVALLDQWKEIYLAIVQDPQLMQVYDKVRIFEDIAKLGGARNIEQYKMNPQPNIAPEQALQSQAQQGNIVPLQELGRGPGARAVGGEFNGQGVV